MTLSYRPYDNAIAAKSKAQKQVVLAGFAVSGSLRFIFDRIAGFCQAARMFRTTGKFIAVILAIWLPLFSGNALAVSVAMQAMEGGHHPVAAQQGVHQSHGASAAQQHMHHAQPGTNPDQPADQQDSAGESCGTCHLACCGYMAAAAIKVVEAQPSDRLFTSLSSQFQSITSIPLDPPPLACA